MKITIKVLKILFITIGAVFIALLILATTPAPFYMHRSLGDDPFCKNDSTKVFKPDYVVMFGGASMPSESNLIRLFYTAQIAKKINSPIIIVHPEDSTSNAEMLRFLTNYGISEQQIEFSTQGSNTRSQALGLKESFPRLSEQKIAVITSPEHINRTIRCLHKCGFDNIVGIAAYENPVDFDLTLKNIKLKGNELIPNIESTNARYTFWNYLKLEITCFREYFAIAYYFAKGWI